MNCDSRWRFIARRAQRKTSLAGDREDANACPQMKRLRVTDAATANHRRPNQPHATSRPDAEIARDRAKANRDRRIPLRLSILGRPLAPRWHRNRSTGRGLVDGVAIVPVSIARSIQPFELSCG